MTNTMLFNLMISMAFSICSKIYFIIKCFLKICDVPIAPKNLHGLHKMKAKC